VRTARLNVKRRRKCRKHAIELETNETDGLRLDSAREIACFRVVQEAITNALRHAAPQRIQVRVIRRPGAISLSIADDGRGFDTATLAAASAGHLGVAGIKQGKSSTRRADVHRLP